MLVSTRALPVFGAASVVILEMLSETESGEHFADPVNGALDFGVVRPADFVLGEAGCRGTTVLREAEGSDIEVEVFLERSDVDGELF